MKKINTLKLSDLNVGGIYYIRRITSFWTSDVIKSRLIEIKFINDEIIYRFQNFENENNIFETASEGLSCFIFPTMRSCIYSLVEELGDSRCDTLTICNKTISDDIGKKMYEYVHNDKQDSYVEGYIDCLIFLSS